ncbi:sigma-70 family RNA polymerase sigma factor [Anaerobacillus alkaliphilus]|uniref:Sigma-70 family RNA polymerase sigma factor n=1 Tax=Anaerobacillus alkaliphilus TaxID=1548597 RepID=A0A4Q0VYV9_9BACI|nr:sigma-70 family RNA polymerase sigma factor [Anaerobacillus alkaliphilus]RXJ04346.1 sigma-70 family RNA polymerase sigma factor [Anaerobacillus alkaliphilus]
MANVEVLENWMNTHTQALVRLAYSYTQDWSTAEDRVQDAFIKAYHSMSQLKNQHAYPWLARIVINECKAAYRKSWREYITSLLPEQKVKSSEDTFIQKQSLEELHDAVMTLPERFSTVMILYYFDNLSVEETAKVIGVSQGTVKSRLSRGREYLRMKLEEDAKYGEGIKRSVTFLSS